MVTRVSVHTPHPERACYFVRWNSAEDSTLMRGVSPRAIAIAFIATFSLDILSSVLLTSLSGADPFRAELTAEQRSAAIDALLADRTFLIWSLLLGTLSTAIGGFIAARFAKSLPYMNAFAFGLLGIVFGALTSRGMPLWYNVLGFAIILPAALFGGHVAKQTKS